MNTHIIKGQRIVENSVRPTVKRVWRNTVQAEMPDHAIYIWGSTVAPRGSTPDDLDIIVVYTGQTIADGQETAIESWVSDEVVAEPFSDVDLLVCHRDEVASVISNSRVSEVYDVSREEVRDPRSDGEYI